YTLSSIALVTLSAFSLAVTNLEESKTNFSPHQYPPSEFIEVRNSLQAREFKHLNDKLDIYESEAKNKGVDESIKYYSEFEIYGIQNKKLELLNAWVESTPNSHHPYLIRSYFYFLQAWDARGNEWASEVESDSFKKMHDSLNLSIKDIDRALELSKESIAIYNLAINIYWIKGNKSKTKEIVNSALKIFPESFYLRNTYIYSLTPRWGGSYSEMQAFADTALPYIDQTPLLEILPGAIEIDMANSQSLLGKNKFAFLLYDKALTYGENAAIYYNRGKLHAKLEQSEEAMADYNKAITRIPTNSSFFLARFKLHAKLENHYSAYSDLIRALELSPKNSDINKQKTWFTSVLRYEAFNLREDNEHEKALSYNKAALSLDENSAENHYSLGFTLYEMYEHDEAEKAALRAINIEPNEIKYYQLYDAVLVRSDRWEEIIRKWDEYIYFNPDDDRAYFEQGGSYFHSGNGEKALELFRVAAEMGNKGAARIVQRYNENNF
ncbi:MAG: tetratricopeptide (TPR) repeat protein, partial [Reinekea sp.]